ncbi:MAG: sigma 54-interacting transcriptional regulator [Deltaproteobacteria bacterium]|nr:sigma 54-interacting transcriptional regulator [Deltaproteobacteria bacterium]
MEIIGEAYRELQDLVRLYAKENMPVLFTGETGTGKELFMSLYIKESKRSGKKMKINCAALSDDLLRSEVFGHVKGSFTGAVSKRDGKIETCKNGILALDEIGDATPQFQASILRVCESNSYSPLGADEEKATNTLLIAATNKPENLRHDLKERFHILPIPPLQKGDIPALATHFLGKPLMEEVIRELSNREYRGNIRELKKACERFKVEKGERIFSNKQNIILSYHFDYYRFRREINTWDRFIQPIIDYYGRDYKFEKYKYKYMSWDGDPLEWIEYNETCKNHKPYVVIYNLTKMYIFLRGIEKHARINDVLPKIDVDNVGYGDGNTRYEDGEIEYASDTIRIFENDLKEIFDNVSLPLLLGYIYLKAETQTVRKANMPQTPHLTYLLNLNLKEAEKEFLKHYYCYNIEKYQDSKELEKAVGMNKKSLDQKYKRNQ